MEQYPEPPHTQQSVKLPSLAWTLLVTLLFGLFGLIPTILHTSKARNLGYPTPKYWVTFGCVIAVNVLLYVLLAANSK